MSNLAEEYPEVDLTIYVGDHQNGVEIAKSNFHANYDVIISRGCTAQMLRQQVPLPVIEIENSFYDILCTLKLAGGLSGRVAMIAFPNVTANAKTLCEFLNYNIDIITIDSSEEVEPSLRMLQKKNYSAILCDMIANTMAKKLGLNAFLITSGIESLRQAFNRALFLCHSQTRLRYENQFLREVIRGQIGQTMIFYTDGKLFYSTVEDPCEEFLVMLRKEIGETNADCERRILRNIDGMLYSIRAQRMAEGDREYVAFFFSSAKTPLSSNQCGISFYSCREMEDKFYSSIYSVSGSVNELQDVIARLNRSTSPLMVSGEDGTGKEYVANVLYTRSGLRDNPFVSINCRLLNDKSWTFLLEHHNSPLADMNYTIYFSCIDELSHDRRRQLLAVLSEMGVCSRNRVIFSCVSQPGESISTAGMEFVNSLCCLTLHLSPLRQLPGRIPPLVSLYLSHLNINMARQILGVEPEAMQLLQEFPWAHNYTQLKRVVNDLAVIAAGQTITKEEVQSILHNEKNAAAFSQHTENAAKPLDINRTLEEIEKDIVCRVLEEMGGNQTAASKCLGISRTTLWRLVRAK
ncbi:MAG: PrpR N-terminal domain-containing protein, partial [Oscillospiraceae bacterium]